MLKERRAWFLFTPRYSPDLNSIGSEAKPTPQAERQMAVPKLKAQHKRMGARIIEAVSKEIGTICDPYVPQECQNHLEAAAYAQN